ncbi:FAD-dependent monooxygenase [Brevundimonas sp.]|uniref:FAD binding domain-containing protein n=1 Tax=Brevundimonas sp. TaxID=1871086 RepID=UPI00289A23B8|nr:FAD-dependent monooxygenase [Brevundimonas sp.]
MKIVVIGGSMAGLFSAALLLRDGHDVEVYERSRGRSGLGAGLVAQPEVFTVMDALGRRDVETLNVPAFERIFLDRAGRIIERIEQPQAQTSWDALYGALRDSVGQRRYHADHPAEYAFTDGFGAGVVLRDGMHVEADLVIGADGMGSVVRSAVLPRPRAPQYAGYVAWRALIEESALPSVSAVLRDRFAFYDAPGEQALGYLVSGPRGEIAAGERRYNAVWYRQAELADVLVDRNGVRHPFSLAPGTLSSLAVSRIKADAEERLPPAFASVFNAVSQPYVQAVFDLETNRMVRGRLALVGDAAFVARPHTAMGVAKAAGDALALSAALREHPTELALQVYEGRRLEIDQSIVDYGRRLGQALTPRTRLDRADWSPDR